MKKNIFNKEEQNLFAGGGFVSPYGIPGGFVPIGVSQTPLLDYDYRMKKLALEDKKIQSKSTKQTNINAGIPKFAYGGLMGDTPTLLNAMPKNIKAIGGVLQTHGSDWSDGLVSINAGQSHEQNPYDGVQIGVDNDNVPNLVEEGECIFNEYVYSKRINLDEDAKKKFHFPKKSELSYADAAKKLEKEVRERPNDPISRSTFKVQMEQLADEQERQKQEMEAQRAKEAFEALSPEEQTALMQQKAQQDVMAEQAAQEQAIAEAQAAQGQPSSEEMAAMEQQAAMAQQQMSPEEAAMMQQQMAAQQGGTPVEGMVPEGYAYGGELGEGENLFARGGKTYKGKKLPVEGAFQSKAGFAKEMEKAGFTDEEIDAYMFDEGHGKSILGGYGNYRARTEPYLKKYQPEYYRQVVAEREKQTKASQAEKANKNAPRYAPTVDWSEGETAEYVSTSSPAPVQKTSSPNEEKKVTPLDNVISKYELAAPEDQYKVENGQVKFWRVGNVAYPTEEAARNALKGSKAAGEKAIAEKASVETPVTEQPVAVTDGSGNIIAYDWYRNGSDGIEEPAGFTVDKKGRIDKENGYTQQYRNIVGALNADNIRQWAADHGWKPGMTDYSPITDPSLKSFLEKGNKLEDLRTDQWRTGATDGKYGFMHHVASDILKKTQFTTEEDGSPVVTQVAAAAAVPPEEVVVTPSSAATRAAITSTENPAAAPKASDAEVRKDGKTTEGTEPDTEVVPNLLPETNYGLLGSAVPLFMQLANVGKPDFAAYDRIAAQANKTPHLASWMPRGDFAALKYPDPWFYTSPILAQSNATQRAINNKVSPSSDAASIANGYNTMIALGNAQRQQDDTLFDRYMKTKQYNGTIYDANQRAHDASSQFNAQVLNHADQFGTQMGLQALTHKDDASRWWNSNLYGNVNAIVDRVNQWEKWKRDHNTIAKMAADSLFGNMSDKQYTGLGYLRTRPKTSSAEGGSVKRKKARKKRGFTI